MAANPSSASMPTAAPAAAEAGTRIMAWADALAQWCAGRFRDTFTAIYLLAVSAVVVGVAAHLVTSAPPAVGTALDIAEPLILAAMLWAAWSGRRRAWQQRWLDYRSLAERLRHLAILWPLARTTPLIRLPISRSPTDPRFGWVGWLLRAVARDAGVITGDLAAPHAAASRRGSAQCLSWRSAP